MDLMLDIDQAPIDDGEIWEWMRNPFPPVDKEEIFFEQVRTKLQMNDEDFIIQGDKIQQLSPALKRKIKDNTINFFQKHNPFIRHIIRRTRQYLENTIDPGTNEPYLKPVRVELFGEGDDEAIVLPGYLRNAYETAEKFSSVLAHRVQSAGFLKT